MLLLLAFADHRRCCYWRTREFGKIRVRMVEYTPGYLSDHWCEKGHVLLCLEGELLTEFTDGRTFTLIPGTSYQVAGTERSRIARARASERSCSWSTERATQRPRSPLPGRAPLDGRLRAHGQRRLRIGRRRRAPTPGRGTGPREPSRAPGVPRERRGRNPDRDPIGQRRARLT